MEIIVKLLIPLIVGGFAGFVGFAFTRNFNRKNAWKYIMAGSLASVVGINISADDVYEVIAYSILFGIAGMTFIKNKMNLHNIAKNIDENKEWENTLDEDIELEEPEKALKIIQRKHK